MQYLWGMINALQLIVHLPLMSFNFPANAKFIFTLFIELTQFDIIPNDFLGTSIFSFDEPEPYSPRFESMGYESKNVIENLGSLFVYIVVFSSLIFIVVFMKLISLRVKK